MTRGLANDHRWEIAPAGSLTPFDLERLRQKDIGRPELREPTAPYASAIREIHRGPDAYVTFHRKRGDKLENLGSVLTAELEILFPEFAAELETDSYFSINSFYRAGFYGKCLPGLKPAERSAKAARYLNACFVDIDFHTQLGPFDFGYQFGQIVNLQDKKIIPPASLVMRSGRGLWLFWLLADSRDGRIPPRAFSQEMVAYNAIEGELIRRTNADPATRDVARITRVPGTVNSKASGDARVVFWTQRAANGRPYVYTLDSLTSFLGVELRKTQRGRRGSEVRPEASARGFKGWQALWQHRLDDFQALRNIRGRFSEGCRNQVAYIYGVILPGNAMAENVVQDELSRLGNECSPPLTDEEIHYAVEQSKRNRGQIRDSTIANFLRVTPEEAVYVPRWAKQRVLPPIISNDLNIKYLQRAECRRQVIDEIVGALGKRPSSRQMADLLRQRGIEVSHVQVSRDYRSLDMSHQAPVLPFSAVSDVTLVGKEREGRGKRECPA
jgi:hypothetical protein